MEFWQLFIALFGAFVFIMVVATFSNDELDIKSDNRGFKAFLSKYKRQEPASSKRPQFELIKSSPESNESTDEIEEDYRQAS